jgi:hypothetical protein
MRRWLWAALGLVLLAGFLCAQTVPRVYWEHDGANVTSYTCQIDSGSQVSLGLPTPNGSTYSALLSACGTLSNGTHTLTIRACNAAGCTAASAIYVVKL